MGKKKKKNSSNYSKSDKIKKILLESRLNSKVRKEEEKMNITTAIEPEVRDLICEDIKTKKSCIPHYVPKEQRREDHSLKNGPVYSFNMNMRLSHIELNKLAEDQQKAYIENILTKWPMITQAAIAEYIDLDASLTSKYLRSLGFKFERKGIPKNRFKDGYVAFKAEYLSKKFSKANDAVTVSETKEEIVDKVSDPDLVIEEHNEPEMIKHSRIPRIAFTGFRKLSKPYQIAYIQEVIKEYPGIGITEFYNLLGINSSQDAGREYVRHLYPWVAGNKENLSRFNEEILKKGFEPVKTVIDLCSKNNMNDRKEVQEAPVEVKDDKSYDEEYDYFFNGFEVPEEEKKEKVPEVAVDENPIDAIIKILEFTANIEDVAVVIKRAGFSGKVKVRVEVE